MKTLSIRQPWAWAILHAGKDIENRDWSPFYPGLRAAREILNSRSREFMIHASSGMTREEYEDFIDTTRAVARERPFAPGLILPAFKDLPRGGIVGTVELVDIVGFHRSPWFFGPIGLVLATPTPLPFIACKGSLGFFEVSV